MSVKLLLILGALALLGVFVFWRIRPYLRVARRVLGVVRDVRRMSVGIETGGAPGRRPTEQRRMGEKLIRCAVCGVWFPASRGGAAMAEGSSAFCSPACLERAGTQPHTTPRGSAR